MIGILPAILCFFIYLVTLPPTIYLGDSGEIVTAASTLGIAHPPGYPLQILLGKISILFLNGDPGFRMNILSAFTGAFCVFIFYLTALELIKVFSMQAGKIKYAALIASLIYGFSPYFWFMSQNAKGFIYVFTHLIFMISLLFLIKFRNGKSARYFYISFYTACFLPVLHNTASLASLFIIGALLLSSGKETIKRFKILILLFVTSFITPWLYLFIRAGKSEMLFGGISGFMDIINHITRAVYKANETVGFSLNSLFFKINNYFFQFLSSYWIAVFLGLIGIIYMIKRDKKAALFGFLLYFFNVTLLFYFTNNTFSPIFVYINRLFYVMPDIIIILFASVGIFVFTDFFETKYGINRIFLATLLLIVPFITFASNFSGNDNSMKFGGYDHAVNYLKTFKESDIFFSKSDAPTFNILYVQKVLKKYTEIKVYDTDGNLFDTSVFEELRRTGQLNIKAVAALQLKMFEANQGRLFLSMMYEYPEKKLKTTPYGMAYAITKDGEMIKGTENFMKLYSLRDYFRTNNLDNFYAETYGRYLVRFAEYAAMNNDMNLFSRYERAANPLINEAPALLKVLATVYFYNLKEYPAAISYLEKAITLDPYDYNTVELVIYLYAKAGRPKAAKWLEFYRRYQQNPEKINLLMAKIRD